MTYYIQLLFKIIKMLIVNTSLYKYISLLINVNNWLYNIKINSTVPTIKERVRLHQFYFINDNHTTHILKEYIPDVQVITFNYKNELRYINIGNNTMDNQDIFLDDISL